MLGFFFWLGLLCSQLNSSGMVWAFLLVSHGVAGLLQVQITLSHFSRPTNGGRADGYGGDFYSRNIVASLDVDCSPWLDWLHGPYRLLPPPNECLLSRLVSVFPIFFDDLTLYLVVHLHEHDQKYLWAEIVSLSACLVDTRGTSLLPFLRWSAVPDAASHLPPLR